MFGRNLRLALRGLIDPGDAVCAIDAAARRLDEWHSGGRLGPRPPALVGTPTGHAK